MPPKEQLHKQDILNTPRAKVRRRSQGNPTVSSVIEVDKDGGATELYTVGHEKKLTPTEANDRLAQIRQRLKSSR